MPRKPSRKTYRLGSATGKMSGTVVRVADPKSPEALERALRRLRARGKPKAP